MKAGLEPTTTLKPPGQRVALGVPIAVVEEIVTRLFVLSNVAVGFKISEPVMVLLVKVTVTGIMVDDEKSEQTICMIPSVTNVTLEASTTVLLGAEPMTPGV
jgi:hypothetical protein